MIWSISPFPYHHRTCETSFLWCFIICTVLRTEWRALKPIKSRRKKMRCKNIFHTSTTITITTAMTISGDRAKIEMVEGWINYDLDYREWCEIKSFSILSRFISYLFIASVCICCWLFRSLSWRWRAWRQPEQARTCECERQTNSKQMKKRNLSRPNENKKNRLPFVQQVVFRSLFHLEDEVPKVVHRHDSDVHSSVVPYLQCNNNRDKKN